LETTALLIEAFGIGSLALAFAKYTLAKRKLMHADDKMKNHSLINRHNSTSPL
jgi:hypothetical protein